MNLLFVADGRSPTAKSWIANIQKDGHQVSLISTYPCQEPTGLSEFHILPIAFSGLFARKSEPGNIAAHSSRSKQMISTFRPHLMRLRYVLGPLTLPFYRKQFLEIVERVGPQFIHALRIPFEGMLAQAAPVKYPLVVSIWGNDLTLHANGSYRMGKDTQDTLRRADGLMADASRDIRLAKTWGYGKDRPTLVVPGCGGIDLEQIEKARASSPKHLIEMIPVNRKLIVNPRGLRPGSLRTDVFFEAVRIVLRRHPEAYFLCPTMAGQSEAEKFVSTIGLGENVLLLPSLDQSDLWWLFAHSDLVISPGEHDGVPNSLLEAMASGCYPVAGDIESLREWIIPGINGLLYPPDDAIALAESILLILDNPDRRFEAARQNRKLIRERADLAEIRKKASGFYELIAGR
jgi:glycosyltransferase involved in cell wall biosynthesis